MRVLLNATPLRRGGAIQVAVATIREALSDPRAIGWEFAVSRAVLENLRQVADLSRHRFHVFETSPARSRQLRRRLSTIEGSMRPDAVFTVFGPTYVRFQAPHLMGCAMPWVTHSTSLAFRTLDGWMAKCRMMARSAYFGYWLRQADRWVTESTTSRHGMHARLKIPLSRIDVVSNSCGQDYLESAGRAAYPDGPGPVRILCFAAAYPHKSLDLVPEVAAALVRSRPGRSFEFTLTLPNDAPLWSSIRRTSERLGVANFVRNVGPVAIVDGVALYRSCDLSFLPTVLETFSATYPESMAMGLPIVTSDLDFARDTCGNAALYFEPRNPVAAADAIVQLLESPACWSGLIDCGKQRLEKLPTPRQKYESYLASLASLIEGQNVGQHAA